MSWGVEAKINLIEVAPGTFEATYFDSEYSEGEVIKIYTPESYLDHINMIHDLAIFNYNTCALCPSVRYELSWQD